MTTLALLTLGITIGAMLLFSFVMAPLVFRILPVDQAGKLIRSIFPHYYLALIVVSVIAGVSAWTLDMLGALLVLLVASGFVVARQLIMPKINQLRELANDGVSMADQKFKQWHFISVAINMAQLIILIAVFIRFVQFQ